MRINLLFGLKKTWIVLVSLFVCTFCYSESWRLTDYVSHSWTTNDGLPSNVITSVTQDSRGYIYFGTYVGLVKFNGSTFSIINRNTSKFVPFVSARVIKESQNKQFWIGSNNEGITILDEKQTACRVLLKELKDDCDQVSFL
jgi:ligand-binding sensor domain-containing protein